MYIRNYSANTYEESKNISYFDQYFPHVFLFHISALTVTNTNCTDYDIKLVNNSISNEGKLMMCINGVWGVFCYNSITTNDAKVICKHLGYPSAS